LWLPAALAQSGAPPVPAPTPSASLTFEVATIRPAKPGEQGGMIRPLPGGDGYVVQNMTIKTMMATLYRVPARQITGGPDWLGTDGFDVQAKADHAYSLDDLHTMFKNMLADRFHLKFHEEAKEGAVYALRIDKGGLKMTPDPAGPDLKIPIGLPNHFVYTGTRVPISYLCFWLGLQLQNGARPVVDQTGLTQVYDFKLSFMPNLPPGISAENLPPEAQNLPSIFDALKEQLGLRLDPDQGPIPYYVVDHADRPTEN
jgi:uncharacterized protein (TIGR03435 family)